MHKASVIFVIAILLISISSCKKRSTENVVIGHNLYIHQNLSDNRELIRLIEQTISHDSHSLSGLISYPCGGGAGCYDLGFVITQIIYRIGEEDFLKLLQKIDKKNYPELLRLIRTGNMVIMIKMKELTTGKSKMSFQSFTPV